LKVLWKIYQKIPLLQLNLRAYLVNNTLASYYLMHAVSFPEFARKYKVCTDIFKSIKNKEIKNNGVKI